MSDNYRQKNKVDMTIPEQLQYLADQICNTRCKYPDIWDEKKEGKPLDESEYCDQCPLNQL